MFGPGLGSALEGSGPGLVIFKAGPLSAQKARARLGLRSAYQSSAWLGPGLSGQARTTLVEVSCLENEHCTNGVQSHHKTFDYVREIVRH
jgi:hypothetical protein